MILCDTGPLVAAALADDDQHHSCVELFTGCILPGGIFSSRGLVVAEVGYLLARKAGAEVEAMFLGAMRTVISGRSTVVRTTSAVRPISSGSRATPAARYNRCDGHPAHGAARADRVATLDRRHFSVVRPRHVDALSLLP